MGLLRTALVFGAGYALGHPDGRRKATELGGQARQLSQRPEVAQLRERGREALANRGRGSGSDTSAAGTSEAGTSGTGPAFGRGWRPRPFPRRAARQVAPAGTPDLTGTTVPPAVTADPASDPTVPTVGTTTDALTTDRLSTDTLTTGTGTSATTVTTGPADHAPASSSGAEGRSSGSA